MNYLALFDKIPILMPDEQIQLPTGPPLERETVVAPESIWAVAQFRDTAGVHWQTTGYGELTEL